ncbi:MAG TPA: V-type ATP synthase subunit A [Gemmatimonadales bacterium]|nr:V-type ATP synthase subunit A [Gemmatimonadales bacterium]
MTASTPSLIRISGALAEAEPLASASLYELVRVGERGLLGEVIRIAGDRATVQVYEETSGLQVGEPLMLTGQSLTVELGPGLLGSVLDGVGRPLARVATASGDFIHAGTAAVTLDPATRWAFTPLARVGAAVHGGDVLGTVEERPGFVHRILVPPGTSGTLAAISAGSFAVADPVARLEDGAALAMSYRWPVRQPRPVERRLPLSAPLVTGQRVFDFLFPVAEGGSVAVPGGFGTGKTVIEQSLAKYAEADVMVYVGCGERGNEMAEVLEEFPRLVDPRTGRPVMDRTVLIVNTSNMPVAAREASVYIGITIAEYYRDMGYRVALMADSLSRWGEALREIGARLQEMPGEEGYPTYLGNRLGKFYERAGRVRALGTPERDGALTVISAISPPGGDFSEPVTQAALRVVGALWALDASLAHQRQFPAVDWETSYSLYAEVTAAWFAEHAGTDWSELRRETLELLQRDRELREIAELVGPEALLDADRLLLEVARMIRETVLGQSAYDPNDALSTLEKTHRLAGLALGVHREGRRALDAGRAFEQLDLASVRRLLAALRRAPAADVPARAAATQAALEALAT